MRRRGWLVAIALLLLAQPAWADNCGDLRDCFDTLQALLAATLGVGLLATFFSLGLDFLPGIGDVKGLIEAWTGKDLVTGEKLEWWQRALGLIPVVGGILKKGAKVVDKAADLVGAAKAADKVGDAADAAKGAGKAGDAAAGAGKAGDAAGAGKAGDAAGAGKAGDAAGAGKAGDAAGAGKAGDAAGAGKAGDAAGAGKAGDAAGAGKAGDAAGAGKAGDAAGAGKAGDAAGAGKAGDAAGAGKAGDAAGAGKAGDAAGAGKAGDAAGAGKAGDAAGAGKAGDAAGAGKAGDAAGAGKAGDAAGAGKAGDAAGAGKAGDAAGAGKAGDAAGAGKKSDALGDVAKKEGLGGVKARNKVAADNGMPAKNYWNAQDVANKHDVVIKVRPTNPDSLPHLKKGALPKPEAVKAKTINEADTYLGFEKGDVGKVGYKKPVEPDYGKVPDHLQDKVRNRYKQRLDEYADRADDMKKLEADGFKVNDKGVVTKDGKDIAGDHDLFQITGPNGEKLSQGKLDDVVNDLKNGDFKAQHGAHMNWPDAGALSPKNQNVFDNIVKGHTNPAKGGAPDAEKLLVIKPGNQMPTTEWFGG